MSTLLAIKGAQYIALELLTIVQPIHLLSLPAPKPDKAVRTVPACGSSSSRLSDSRGVPKIRPVEVMAQMDHL